MNKREREKVEIKVITEKCWGFFIDDEDEDEDEEIRDSHAPISMKLPPAKDIEKSPIVLDNFCVDCWFGLGRFVRIDGG